MFNDRYVIGVTENPNKEERMITFVAFAQTNMMGKMLQKRWNN